MTSQRGQVAAVDPEAGTATLRMDDGSLQRLAGDDLGADRLSYGYALTVHRSQGLTTDTCHHLADGGGRELAYVAASRARQHTTIHLVADDLDQAVEDLARDWSQDRRPRWAIDTGTPTTRAQLAVNEQMAKQLQASIDAAVSANAEPSPPDLPHRQPVGLDSTGRSRIPGADPIGDLACEVRRYGGGCFGQDEVATGSPYLRPRWVDPNGYVVGDSERRRTSRVPHRTSCRLCAWPNRRVTPGPVAQISQICGVFGWASLRRSATWERLVEQGSGAR